MINIFRVFFCKMYCILLFAVQGLLPEGSIALIEGFYDDKILYVTGIGLPPCESSEISRRAFSVSNPFGGCDTNDSPAAPLDTKMHKLLTTTQVIIS